MGGREGRRRRGRKGRREGERELEGERGVFSTA